MLRSPLTWGGLVLVFAGVVWLLQGLGYLAGSAMSGETLWAVIGPIVALIGVGMLMLAGRKSHQ